MIYGHQLALRALEICRDIRNRLRRTYSATETQVDDAQQEALVKLLERGLQDRPLIENVDGYLFRAVRNQLLDQIRVDAARPLVSWDAATERVADDRRTPEDSLDWQQRAQLVVNAAIRLPKPLRRVLWLSKRERLTFREIAERMGVPEERVKADMARAVYRIREKVARAFSLRVARSG